VIVVIGFSFAFFGNLMSQTTQTAEEQAEQQTEQMTKTVRIVAVSGNQLLVKSTASTVDINTDEISVYFINSTSGTTTKLDCNWGGIDAIGPQETATCDFSGTTGISDCTSPDKIKVVSPSGNQETKTC